MLLAAGADCEARNNKGDRAIEKAVKANNTIAFGLLLDHMQLPQPQRQQFLDEALHMAIIAGAHKSVEQLLTSYGADANAVSAEGLSCVHQAAGRGFRHFLVPLVQAGADVEAATPDGDTALHLAVRGGRLDCIATLLEADANVNAKNNAGMTPLHEAAAAAGFNAIKQLLEKGAAANEQDMFGWTPLHYTIHYLSHDGSALAENRATGGQRWRRTSSLVPDKFSSREPAQPTPCRHLLLSFGAKEDVSGLYGITPAEMLEEFTPG